jgi:hypothetical protein
MYPNIIYDAEDNIYKCWYNSFIKCGVSENVPPGKRNLTNFEVKTNRKSGVCYAYSEDGINWIKPNLRLIEFKGSSENNLVMKGAHHSAGGAGVFKDEHESDSGKRYKMFFKGEKEKAIAVVFSADGINWTDPITIKWPKYDIEGDTHNNALWDPSLKKYVGFTRSWSEGWFKGQRVVSRTESTDFINWSEPVEVFRGKDEHDQIYSMPVFKYANVYIGLPAVFHHGNLEDKDWDKVTTQLAWSPDTKNWYRICPGEELIPRGAGSYPTGEYDCGCIYAAAYPVFKENEILLYYLGSNGMHTHWREGSLNLARLRSDGFAGHEVEDSSKVGLIKTSIFENKNNELKINSDINDNDGYLKVSVLDEKENEIPGYTLEDSITVRNNTDNSEITWDGKNLSQLKGKKICFKFKFQLAKIYSFGG